MNHESLPIVIAAVIAVGAVLLSIAVSGSEKYVAGEQARMNDPGRELPSDAMEREHREYVTTTFGGSDEPV